MGGLPVSTSSGLRPIIVTRMSHALAAGDKRVPSDLACAARPDGLPRDRPMDQAKLQRLRDRYSGRGGGEFHDPEFKAVAESQFQGDRRKWPFAEPGTF